MIVGKDGHVSGSVNRAQLLDLFRATDDEELKAEYRALLGDSEEGAAADAAPEPELFIADDVGSVVAAEPEPQRPPDYAAKAEWIAWAVHKGADEADASNATKTELIELYGGED